MKEASKQREHTQLIGRAIIDNGVNSTGEEKRSFLFEPDESIQNSVDGWQARGKFTILTTGQAEFCPERRKRSEALLIKKLPHGRISETKDDAYLLTIKVFKTEPGNITCQMLKEASEAVDALAARLS